MKGRQEQGPDKDSGSQRLELVGPLDPVQTSLEAGEEGVRHSCPSQTLLQCTTSSTVWWDAFGHETNQQTHMGLSGLCQLWGRALGYTVMGTGVTSCPGVMPKLPFPLAVWHGAHAQHSPSWESAPIAKAVQTGPGLTEPSAGCVQILWLEGHKPVLGAGELHVVERCTLLPSPGAVG